MSALLPPVQKSRKPGLPSPRLQIPSTSSASVSSASSASSSSPALGTPSSSTRPGGSASDHDDPYSSSKNQMPRLDQLSLTDIDKDLTLRPGLVTPAAVSMPTTSKPGKPKLGLHTVKPSPPLSLPQASPYASSATSTSSSSSMSRSESFEGQLLSQVSFTGEEEYRLSRETLEDLGKLGEGASGEVRKVRHRPTGKILAKKTIPASPNQDVQKQILRELAFNRECRADWITRYYGAFLEDSDSQIAICMEYCEGGSLDAIYKRIKQRKGRTGEKVLGKVAEAVLQGLNYLHDRKIIHRDIKPSNILVTRKGCIKLCDFGISGELINSMAGTFCGTSYYMAPERIRGAKYTITADIWSLGLTIHEVAMNRFPFPPEGEPPLGPIELLSYIVHMETPELKDNLEQGVKWTKAIQDFVRQCLVKDPALRPSPTQLIQHNWIKKSQTWNPDLEAWVAQVWEW